MLPAVTNGFATVAFAFVAGVLSHVIYGLQTKVREAMELGQYTLEAKLGEGGMGAVYRARHQMMRRPTAVKLLRRDRADEKDLARFEREVQLTTLLTHPNTITIFDYGRTDDGTFYYVMELLDGAALDRIVGATGAQPPERVVSILRQVASALEEAHGIGLVHRDIKPGNIILSTQGGKPDVAKLVDFGLVKGGVEEGDPSLTADGTITGTPLYLAPEVITSPDSYDARGDIYALGAVGYYLITGQHVFEGRSLVEICAHHLHSQPTPPSKRLGREVPAELERLILDCLAKDPVSRPFSATEVIDRLDRCPSMLPWSVDRARKWWDEHGEVVKTPQGWRTPAVFEDHRHRPSRCAGSLSSDYSTVREARTVRDLRAPAEVAHEMSHRGLSERAPVVCHLSNLEAFAAPGLGEGRATIGI